MKNLTLILFLLASLSGYNQVLKELNPSLGALIDKSPEGEEAYLEVLDACDDFLRNYSDKEDYENLSEEDKRRYDSCLEEPENYWDVIGVGCSWYCGGGLDTLTGSSALKPQNDYSYEAKNIHDLNYKTAWVEGVPGDGIGESITYHFPPQNPRITEIIVVNGYVKSEKSWVENSRVKQLKMYLNEVPYAILNLEDVRNEQHFTFEPLGNANRKDWDALQKQPWWTIKFEILEVYKGDKYDDTAITEIYFDGIDVH